MAKVAFNQGPGGSVPQSTTYFAGYVLGEEVSYLYLAVLNPELTFGSGLTFIPFDQTFVSADAALTSFSFGGRTTEEVYTVLRKALLRLYVALDVRGLPTTTAKEAAALDQALETLAQRHGILSNEEVRAFLEAPSDADRDALAMTALNAMSFTAPPAANDT